MTGWTIIYISVSISIPTLESSFLCNKAHQLINHECHRRNQAKPPGATRYRTEEREREIKQTPKKCGGMVTNEGLGREENESRRSEMPFTELLCAHFTHITSFSLHNSPRREESFSLILETWKSRTLRFNYCNHGYPAHRQHSWDLKAVVPREPTLPDWLSGREERTCKAREGRRKRGKEERKRGQEGGWEGRW